jgi:hypothetical protein
MPRGTYRSSFAGIAQSPLLTRESSQVDAPAVSVVVLRHADACSLMPGARCRASGLQRFFVRGRLRAESIERAAAAGRDEPLVVF